MNKLDECYSRLNIIVNNKKIFEEIQEKITYSQNGYDINVEIQILENICEILLSNVVSVDYIVDFISIYENYGYQNINPQLFHNHYILLGEQMNEFCE